MPWCLCRQKGEGTWSLSETAVEVALTQMEACAGEGCAWEAQAAQSRSVPLAIFPQLFQLVPRAAPEPEEPAPSGIPLQPTRPPAMAVQCQCACVRSVGTLGQGRLCLGSTPGFVRQAPIRPHSIQVRGVPSG